VKVAFIWKFYFSHFEHETLPTQLYQTIANENHLRVGSINNSNKLESI